jgi:hypothetical protein
MQDSYIGRKRTVMLSLTAIMILTVAWSCTRRNMAPPPAPTQGATLSTNERAVIVHRGDDGTRRYYRDENGKLFFVDQEGAVHSIERNARVEHGAGGLYYIIDDDNVQYSTDDNGRLYYRDSGTVRYIEEGGSGRVIDPLPILQGGAYPRMEQVHSLESCNDDWRKCSTKCDNEPGLSNKRTCLENCDYHREQCLKPY